MRKLFAAFAIGALLSTGALTAQVKKREVRQQKRVNKGVKSGELTKKETLKIEAAEAKLHKEIKEDRKDGPGPHTEGARQDQQEAKQAQQEDLQAEARRSKARQQEVNAGAATA